MADTSKPNVSGMVQDPDFLKLAPSDQRQALFKLTGDQDFSGLSDGDTLSFVSKMNGGKNLAPPIPKPQVPMQQSNLGIALGSNADSPMNPMQPGEQWAIQNPNSALGAAGIGALGAAGTVAPSVVNGAATAATPLVVKLGQLAVEHPTARTILVEAAKKAAGGTALAAGYKYGKKLLDSK